MSNRMLDEATKALAQARTSEGSLALPDVIVAAGACLGAVVVGAVPGWVFLAGAPMLYLGLVIALTIVGIVVARKSPVRAPVALGYSFALGLMVGAFSHSAVAYGGTFALIGQAVLGTIGGAIGMLAVSATPFGRRAGRAVKLLMAVLIGYMVLGVVSVLAAIFLGTGNGWGFYGVSGIGLALCLLGVAVAAWSLLSDIVVIGDAISQGAPRSWMWSFGMSLASSLVFLYLEILRLLAISSR